tara:strand:- start:56 stop:445 length:390 start_codon:yes stop_codon:yes gene_type:complete
MNRTNTAEDDFPAHDETQSDVFRKIWAADALKYQESAAAQALDMDGRMADYEGSLKVLCLASAAMALIPGVGIAGLAGVAILGVLLFGVGILQIVRGFKSEGELTLVAALVAPLIGVLTCWIQVLVTSV